MWPIAWLWAYVKPVGYKGAYGTEKHEDYFHEVGARARSGELLEREIAHLRDELDAMDAKGALTADLKLLRRDLSAVMLIFIDVAVARDSLMEALLLATTPSSSSFSSSS